MWRASHRLGDWYYMATVYPLVTPSQTLPPMPTMHATRWVWERFISGEMTRARYKRNVNHVITTGNRTTLPPDSGNFQIQNRILLTSQTDSKENGIYTVVSSGALAGSFMTKRSSVIPREHAQPTCQLVPVFRNHVCSRRIRGEGTPVKAVVCCWVRYNRQVGCA